MGHKKKRVQARQDPCQRASNKGSTIQCIHFCFFFKLQLGHEPNDSLLLLMQETHVGASTSAKPTTRDPTTAPGAPRRAELATSGRVVYSKWF